MLKALRYKVSLHYGCPEAKSHNGNSGLITWRQPDEGNRHLTHAPLKAAGPRSEHSDRSPKREVAVLTQWIKRGVTSQGKEHGFSERNNRSKTSRDDFRLLDFAVDPRCREIGHRRSPEGRLE